LAAPQNDSHQCQEAIQRLIVGETQADVVARTYSVDATTIGRLAASSPFEHGHGAVGNSQQSWFASTLTSS
jgi:hypothetical protein